MDASLQISPQINSSWLKVLLNEFNSPYFAQLKKFLLEEKKLHKVYPPSQQIFNAYNLTPFDKVKVVIIGQDPYHGDNQAHGLCFSVQEGIKTPPSLVNIYKEMKDDLGIAIHTNGNLEKWTQQGVFLLNATLTVRAHQAGSHQNNGWEQFTDATIRALSNSKKNLVFILWGNFAQQKANLIDASKHLILKAAHPSPFAAYKGFFGCKHFSKTNKYLTDNGIEPIDWALS